MKKIAILSICLFLNSFVRSDIGCVKACQWAGKSTNCKCYESFTTKDACQAYCGGGNYSFVNGIYQDSNGNEAKENYCLCN